MNDYIKREPKTKKAATIDNELERIYRRDGEVSPESILESARSPKSPLHQYFEWDDSLAAERYRLEQARQMIMRSKLIVQLVEARKKPPTNVTVRKFLPTGQKTRKFKMRPEVLSDDDARAALIDDHIKRLIAWCRAIPDVKELKELRRYVEAGIEKYTE